MIELKYYFLVCHNLRCKKLKTFRCENDVVRRYVNEIPSVKCVSFDQNTIYTDSINTMRAYTKLLEIGKIVEKLDDQ